MRYSEKRTRFLVIALLAVSAAFAVSAFGQGGATGTITGIVTDTSGAVVPGASVLLQNTGTNVKWQTKSDSSGVYLFSNLPVGAYALKVTAAGFAAAEVPGLRLEVNATIRQDIKLPLGKMTQSVSVKAAPPMLNTSNASIGQVIASTEVTQLPLNGRDFQQLQLLTPGTVSGTNFQTGAALNGGASSLNTNETLNISNGGRVQTFFWWMALMTRTKTAAECFGGQALMRFRNLRSSLPICPPNSATEAP